MFHTYLMLLLLRQVKRKAVIYFIFCILTGICSYQLYKVIGDFITGDKWTNTIKPVRTHALEFPTLTLCNYNRVNKSRLPEVGVTEEIMQIYVKRFGFQQLANESLQMIAELSLVDHLLSVIFEVYWNTYPVTHKRIAPMNKDIAQSRLGRSLYTAYFMEHPEFSDHVHFLQAVALKCHAVYSCRFMKMPFDCCKDSKQIFTEYGACYTIRPPMSPPPWHKAPHQLMPGVKYGLELIMCARVNQAISTLLNNQLEVGFHAFIGYEPTSTAENQIPLPVGFHSFVELKQTVETTSSDGFVLFQKTCVDKKKTDRIGQPYSVATCMVDCIADQILKKCNCIPPELTRGDRRVFRFCQPNDLIDCAYPKMKVVWTKSKPSKKFNDSYAEYSKCRSYCNPRCSRQGVDLTTTQAVGPSPNLVPQFMSLGKKMGLNLTEEVFVKGFTLVDLYFKELSYTWIHNYPKATLEQLLGNIGGVIGLWIGASIFTIVQMIDQLFNSYQTQKEKADSPSEVTQKQYNPKLITSVIQQTQDDYVKPNRNWSHNLKS